LSTAGDLWDVLDPEKPETINAALDHLRASLSEGLCPFCAGRVENRVVIRPAYLCWPCLAIFPVRTPADEITMSQSGELRAGIVRVLLQFREPAPWMKEAREKGL
jgi:hypothetical protein